MAISFDAIGLITLPEPAGIPVMTPDSTIGATGGNPLFWLVGVGPSLLLLLLLMGGDC